MSTKSGQLRQGDVLLVPVAVACPVGETVSEVVLARGETTGHTHRILAPRIQEWTSGGKRYVFVLGDEPGVLIHEDHDPQGAAVVVPRQAYQVVPQREWGLGSQWRKVVD